MKMRRVVSPWIFGIIGAVSLVAVACGSSVADDSEADQTQLSGGSGTSGVLVTDRDTAEIGDTGDATVWLGVETATIPEFLAGLIGVPAGERVAWVAPGGPADAILILGDTITAIDGLAIEADHGLAAMVSTRTAGESVAISVLRGGESLDLQITLGEKAAHGSDGSLSEIHGLVDRAISGELNFLDSDGGEHTVSFASGTLSGVNAGRVTMTRTGGGPMTVTLSPNVFVWIDGGPGTLEDLENATGDSAKIVIFDDVVLAVFAGGVIPPVLENLEGLFGAEGDGLLESLELLEGFGALGDLLGLFGVGESTTGDAGL
jgi:hypothetical protein